MNTKHQEGSIKSHSTKQLKSQRKDSQHLDIVKVAPIPGETIIKTSQDQLVHLTFENLNYSVIKTKTGQTKELYEQKILNNLAGICFPGELTAILGSSGAGKTSLLNILARRITLKQNLTLSGDLLANKQPYDAEKFASFASYVMQNDVLFGTLTVREAFTFVARLKYQSPVIQQEKINESIKMLKLDKCVDTLIGNEMIKGISGGERKRTSIGVELVTDPFCILLDEPTSGLDSFTAFVIINLLKQIAKKKQRTIVFTIHQPSSDIFQLFDRIMLLCLGQFIYQGPKDELVTYFGQIGYQCPQHSNPLDFLMGITHIDNPKHVDYEFLFSNYQNQQHPSILQAIANVEKSQITEKTSETSFGYQVAQILNRAIVNVKRDKLIVRGRLAMTIFFGLFMGGVYFGVGRKEANYSQMQSMIGILFFLVLASFMGALNPVMVQFPAEREVFLREENSKLYSTAAYFFGKSTIEIPFIILFPIIQQVICYWMIGLNDSNSEIVIINIFICILLGLAGNSIGLMAGSMFKDVKTAASMIPMVLMPLILFSGFFANQSNFMNWIGWVQYLSPLKYCFESLVWNEYTNVVFEQTNNINKNPNPIEFYDLSLGLWTCIYIMCGYIIFYRIMALVFLYLLRDKQQ